MGEKESQALSIYLDSATFFNNFEPLSDRRIAAEMVSRGIDVGKSTIARWRVMHGFEESLRAKIDKSLVDNENLRSMITKSSDSAIIEKTIVDLERNNNLTADCYDLLEGFIEQKQLQKDKGLPLDKDDVGLIIKIANLTTGREDRMLDRRAMLGAVEMMSKDDSMKALADTIIDIEED